VTVYATFAVPASGTPIFQAASANLNSLTEAKVDTKTPAAGTRWSSTADGTT